MLILGCGNADRSDDAAGLLVVSRLRQLGIDAREHGGDTLGLIEAWDGASEVLVVDAIVSGAEPGTILVWNAVGQASSLRRIGNPPCAVQINSADDPLPAGEFRCSTHDLGVAEAVELARVLGRLPAKLTIYGIEGARFGRGGLPCPEVTEAAERLAQKIAQEVVGCTSLH